MMPRKAAIIAYDIASNKRRRQVFRCLKSWSLDSQYSLFECNLTQAEAEELFIQLGALIDHDEDTLMLAWLDKKRQARALTEGGNVGFQSPAWYLG